MVQFLAAQRWADGVIQMSKRGEVKQERVAPLTWVNISVNDAAKQEILRLAEDLLGLLFTLAGLVGERFKVSVSYDEYSAAVQVALICADPDSPRAHYALSARHPDLVVSLATVVWKYFSIIDLDWAELVRPTPADSWS
jgi:hypothetical protein